MDGGDDYLYPIENKKKQFLEITDFTIDGDELIINNNRDVIKNDVVRVYELENISDNLFENVEYARENFKVIINTFFIEQFFK